MVTAKECQTYQQFSAWNSSHLDDHMALLQQNYSMPCFPPSTMLAPNVATLTGQSVSDLRGLNSLQQDAGDMFFKQLPPYRNILDPTGSPYLKLAPQCGLPHGLGVTDKLVDAPQKRFLIVDQSGSQTRLFFSPSFSPQTLATANGPFEDSAARLDQQILMKPVVEEKWDENNLTDGEDEMLEDTEEINALLYSDSDDEYNDDNDDDDGENDEVTSTGRTPFSIEEDEGYNKDKLLKEVASSDGSPKRQRLLDGKYKKSSLVSGSESLLKKWAISCSYEDDVGSSCAGDGKLNDYLDFSDKREKKVKIREALKILESIIPGLNSKDPLSIIDKAIIYLKSMKMEAEALGLSYTGCGSATSS